MENKLLEKEENINDKIEEISPKGSERVVPEVVDITAEENQPEEVAEETLKEPKVEEIEIAPIEKLETPVFEDAPAEPDKDEENVPFFKSVKWKRIWDKSSGLILALLTAIPSLILAYILILFFLT